MKKQEIRTPRTPQDVLRRVRVPKTKSDLIDFVFPIGCVLPSDEASGPGKLYPDTVWKKVDGGEGVAFFKRTR